MGTKNMMKNERAEAAQKVLGLFWKNSLVLLLNNALFYMFPQIQNETVKKECIWAEKGALLLPKRGCQS